MSRSAAISGLAALVLGVPLLVAAQSGTSPDDASADGSMAAAKDGRWGPEELIADDSAGPRALVRVRARGSAVAAWIDRDREAQESRLMVGRRRAGGGWSAPQAVSRPLGTQTRFDVAVGPPGFASIVWRQRAGDRWRIKESHLASGGWTAARTVGSTGVIGRPRTTIDGRGTTTVVWSGRGVRSARLREGGVWRREPVTRSGGGRRLELSSNANGDLVVAWLGDGFVHSALRPHGGAWTRPRTWGRANDSLFSGLRTAIDGRGRAMVAWSTIGSYDYNYVAWARSTTAGAWSPARLLTRSVGEDGGGLNLSMNGAGVAVAVWIQVETSDRDGAAWAARFRPAGTWGPPRKVSRAAWHFGGHPGAFMDRRGVAHALVETDRMRILSFHQRAGRPWSDGRIIAYNRWFEDSAGQGMRLVVVYSALYSNQGLHAIAWDGTR